MKKLKRKYTGSNGIVIAHDEESGKDFYIVPTDDHVVKSKRQVEAAQDYFKREASKRMGRERAWVACYHEPIKRIADQLGIELLGALMKLLPYIQFESEGLLKRGKMPMTRAEVEKAIKRSTCQTKMILKRLEDAGVLFKRRNGRTFVYYVSEEYHTKGKARAIPFTKLFQTYAREKLEKLTLQEAGLLYMVLPYFHPTSFLLCTNPCEPDRRKAEPMTQKELSELLGISVEQVRRHMRKLSRLGIVRIDAAFGAVNYRVHPDYMYRMDGETPTTMELRESFEKLNQTTEKPGGFTEE